MGRVISYTIKVDGVSREIKNQGDFRKAVRDTQKVFDKADFGTEKYEAANKQLAALKVSQTEARRESRKLALQQQVDADKGERSLKGLTAQLKLLELQYQELGEQARQTGQGLALSENITNLRGEIREINQGIGKQGLTGALSEALGSLGGFDIASLVTPLGAAAAGIQLIGESAQFVNQTVEEFIKLRGEVQNLTGATGSDLDTFVARIDGIAESFEKTNEEVLNAANAVSDQFEIPFTEALDKIAEGFIAGSDQQGQFLDGLREYPTFFQEAGLSADEFFKIANQQATQGIFGDKGLDAVKEATLRLRELPQATRDAVDAIGLDATEIQNLIADEGIGAAIATVSAQLATLEADSPQVGQALADIFGGPGEDAGLNFILSLQNINDTTESLIDTNNDYQTQQQRLLEINTEFAALQNELTLTVGEQTTNFKNFALEVRNGALRLLIFLIENFKTFFQTLAPVRDAVINLLQAFGLLNEQGQATGNVLNFLQKTVDISQAGFKFLANAIATVVNRLAGAVTGVRGFLRSIGIIKKDSEEAASAIEDTAEATQAAGEAADDLSQKQEGTSQSTKDLTKEIEGYRMATLAAATATDQFAKGSIAELSEEVGRLKKEIDQAAPGDQQGLLSQLLDAEKALEEAQEFRRLLRERLTTGGDFSLTPVIEANAGQRLEVQRQAVIDELKINKDRKDEIIRIEQETLEAIVERQNQRLETIRRVEQQRLEDTIAISGQIFSAINQGANLLSQAQAERSANEVAQLEARFNKEIELAEGNADLQESLREELAEERAKIQKREFQEQKKFRVATALTSLFEGIVNILAAPTTIPDPFGRIFKGVQIGFLNAATAIQIAAINRQNAAKGAIIPRLAGGNILSLQTGGAVDGQFRGQSHTGPAGGIPISFRGHPFLVENGERFDTDETGAVAIINKRSAAAFGPQLRAAFGKSFPGKRRWLSHINNHNNWGVPYLQEGAILPDLTTGLQASFPGAALRPVVVEFDNDSILTFARTTGQAVQNGAQEGTSRGLFDANRRIEREQRLNRRVGLE